MSYAIVGWSTKAGSVSLLIESHVARGQRRPERGAMSVKLYVPFALVVEGEAALAAGLVDEVVEPGQGLARAESLAADIAKRGPVAVQIVKAMINFAEGEDSDAPIEGLAGGLTAMTQDLAEGVASFRAKRAPTFNDR